MKKRVGIVGCGSIARTHVWTLGKLKDIKIVGFCDTDIDRAKEFSNTYTEGNAKAYDDLKNMLINAKLDVLHICTPHYLHVPMALEAMKYNVNVFSEKPPAICMEQFEQLKKENSLYNVRLGFCFQNRYNKTTLFIDELILSKKLGNVTGARAFVTWRRDEEYYSNDWKGRLETEGGGALINQSIHTLDLMLRYLGRPLTVKSHIANHHLKDVIEVEDTVEAWMSFENGNRACFYASTAYITDAPVILELQCDKGSITLIDKTIIVRDNDKEPQYHTVNEPVGIGKSYWGNGHLSCISDYYSKLDSNEVFQNDYEGVKVTMETMMRIYEGR